MTLTQPLRKTGLAWTALFVILVTVAAYDVKYADWNDPRKIIFWDVLSYYAYLPAVYIHHDISLGFIDENPELYREKFWPGNTPTGRHFIKTTMGQAFLYAPFFWAAHPVAQMLGYAADGFSIPYRIALMLSALFYLAIGLFFLKKVLERFFSDAVVALTLVCVTLGTNLLHFATFEATMPHVYNFSLFSIWMYLCLKWHDRPGLPGAIGLGLVTGLIALIRPTNVLVVILFVLWGVKDIPSLQARCALLLKKAPLIIVMIMASVVVWIPQMLYWKFVAGTFWLYSYGNERFFFAHPHILQGLFGFRKGWLVYTPMMALALAGIGFMYKHFRDGFYPVLIFTILNIYVIFSWWSWWYGGSFGLRPVIESYSILSIPLAVLLTAALKRNTVVKMITCSIITVFMSLNMFQMYQYRTHLIHWDGMTARAYRAVFLKLEMPDNFQELIERPDYANALLGLKEEKGHPQPVEH